MNPSFSKMQVFTIAGNCVTPAGMNLDDNLKAVEACNSAISKVYNNDLSEESFFGAVINDTLIENAFSDLPYEGLYTRLEKIMLISLNDIKLKYSSLFNERCGVIFSTTKGNIDVLNNLNIEDYYLHNLAKKVCATIGINTEPIVLSNACVSGIMAVSVAKRLIQTGGYDHFLIVGGDIFSKFVFSGFQAFQAVSPEPCKPYSKNRDGITLGEAAAALFISKDSSLINETSYKILGDSSKNDANHISGPSRTGEGLHQSIEEALKEAQISPSEIDCISSHGTATIYNDEMEAIAFDRSQLSKVPVFSLKGFYGHTLGAAGLLELVISLSMADRNKVPPSFGFDEIGVSIPINVSREQQNLTIKNVLKTASGFGGSNTAVIFQKHKLRDE
jgi:3-oxoacyl-[acyl-carrier-protein] synthase-1